MSMPTIEGHVAEANGQRLHYLIAGSGPPLVLLHGWPQHSHQWRPIIPALAEQFTVVAPDLRGAGGSTKPRGGYTKREMAVDVHELVARLFSTSQVRLCGYDHGGTVAYQYAVQWPDEVERLAVLEMILPGFGLEDAMVPRRGWDQLWQLAAFTVPDVCERFMIGRERDLLSWYFWRGADNPNAISMDDFEVYVRALQLPNALRAGMEYFAAVWDDADDNIASSKTSIESPVLAVGGAAAMGTLVETSMSQLAKEVQGVVLDDAGHWLTDEQPGELTTILLDFFTHST